MAGNLIEQNTDEKVYLGKAFAQGLDDLDAIMMGYANVFFRNVITKPQLPALNGYAVHYGRGIPLRLLLGLTSMIVFFLYFVQRQLRKDCYGSYRAKGND